MLVQRPIPLPKLDCLGARAFIDRERGFYEIVPRGCSKATGISHMAELLHIPMEDTVAIGDSNNDYSMLEIAGTGIAMGNACPELKAVADAVCGATWESGIAEFLREKKLI